MQAGPGALADYELLEMILFPAKPLGDVKPLAKTLIGAFGSFGQVLFATPQELMKVEGVNEAAVVAYQNRQIRPPSGCSREKIARQTGHQKLDAIARLLPHPYRLSAA